MRTAPVAGADADVAALGHSRPRVEAGRLGRVELGDLGDHHLLALELMDANEGT